MRRALALVLLTLCIAGVMLATGGAGAQSLAPALFQQSSQWWRNGATVAFDFVNNRYMFQGTEHSSLASMLTALGGSFTRGSTATYFDVDGVLRTAATNEARVDYATPSANLLPASQGSYSRFSCWNCDIATSQLAPDGTSTAVKITTKVAAAAGIDPNFRFSGVPVSVGSVLTISSFVKYGNHRYLSIGADVYSPSYKNYCGFDLISGATAFTLNAVASINPAANGWYRVTCSFTAAYTPLSDAVALRFSDSAYSTSFIPPVGSYAFVWGSVLQLGSATPYGLRKGILIEEGRTNFLLNSGSIGNSTGWSTVPSSGVVTLNAGTAPNGTNTATLHDRVTGVTNDYIVRQTYAAASATTYTASVFAKAGTRNTISIQPVISGGGGGASCNLTSGTALAPGSYGTGLTAVASRISNVGNGWYRCEFTFSIAASTAVTIWYGNDTSVTGTAYIWGAQLEEGAYSTSYIPTSGTTATRHADVLNIPTGPWFDATKGTLEASGYSYNAINNSEYLLGVGSGSTDLVTIRKRVSSGAPQLFVMGREASTSIDGSYATISLGVHNKYALSFAEAQQVRAAMNGVGLPNAGVFGTGYGSSYTNLYLGAAAPWNGHIESASYSPLFLSSQALADRTQ